MESALGWKSPMLLVVFLLAYVALFVGVPPIPLCLFGTCPVSPRPEAFLLPLSLAFGAWAILGVALGVFASALVYEAINPMGVSPWDAGVAFLVVFAACWLGRWYFLRRPSLEGPFVTTWILTGLVALFIGSYAGLTRGTDLPTAYAEIIGEALIPINVLGAFFLVWSGERLGKRGERSLWPRRQSARETQATQRSEGGK